MLAVHLSDGVLLTEWWIAGFIMAALLLLPALLNVPEEEIPRIALLSAAFFVSSLIHVKLGPTSVHLLLTGLLGVILGRRTALAVAVGLTLQTVLLGHGGYTSLGWNIVIMTVPALVSCVLFRTLRRVIPVFWAGLITGSFAVVATCAFNAAVLSFAGIEDFTIIAWTMFLAHLPVAGIEGLILGTTSAYLAKVKPELLGDHVAPAEPTTSPSVPTS